MLGNLPTARWAWVAAVAGGLLLGGAPGRAQEAPDWLLTMEAGGALAVTEPQRTLFGPGGSASVGVHRVVGSFLSLGVRFRGVVLSDGAPPADPGRVDPGLGTAWLGALVLRLRPPAAAADPRRGTGPWLEVGAGGGVTGELRRASWEAGAGWSFQVGSVSLGPAVRYLQIVEREDQLDARDARIALATVELTLLDARPAPPKPEAPRPPSDRDGDGIVDEEDRCPDEPEDRDGFEDEDGCPDLDDDADGIPDTEDACQFEPEDRDGFEDEDGCPDADNDGDGILDPDDACPNEPEVLNGVDDEDGCPDEGLIEMIDDRIVLEERLLFDTERAKLRPGSLRVLQAIVDMWRQHPEWARLRVEGHADDRGPDEFNDYISEKRARVVRRRLVELGIPDDIIEAVGYGERRPRVQGHSDEAHQANRRVEFVVVARHPVGPDGRVQVGRVVEGSQDEGGTHSGGEASPGGSESGDGGPAGAPGADVEGHAGDAPGEEHP